MKPKSITKKATKRKRPKSVLQKAWATRRANAETVKKLMASVPAAQAAAASLSQDTKTLGTETPRSENAATAGGINPAYDAIVRNNQMHRDDMLLGFMGDMAGMRRINNSGHYPVMVSRAQAEAIESFLDENGYSPWGRRTGPGESPPATKAA